MTLIKTFYNKLNLDGMFSRVN